MITQIGTAAPAVAADAFVRGEQRRTMELSEFRGTWVVLALCQLAVTVAGNLAVIPLTGVTFPFVSFGMTSLVAGAAMLGLCASINVAGPAS